MRTRHGSTAVRLLILGMVMLALPARRVRATTAADLCSAAADPCVVAVRVVVGAGSLIDVGSRELRVANGGALQLASGEMTVRGQTVTVAVGGALTARGTRDTEGGSISVVGVRIEIAGTIDVSGAAPGTVNLTADGRLVVPGRVIADSLSFSDDGGDLNLRAAEIVIPGELSARGGGDGFGGTATLKTPGDVTLTGTVDVVGGDGGEFTADAGAGMSGAGNLVIGEAAGVDASARTAAESGGLIDLSASGDGVATGHVTIRGGLKANGRGGNDDLGGGSGGSVNIDADGDIRIDRDTGSIFAEGGGPDGEGGEVDIVSTKGVFATVARITVDATGVETAGGSIDISARMNVSIGAPLDAFGGGFDGGSISIESIAGSILVSESGGVDVSSTSGGGFGGSISVTATGTTGVGVGQVLIAGMLDADGSGSTDFPGDGGDIGLLGSREVRVSGRVDARGAGGGGSGGSMILQARQGDVVIDANARLTMTGAGSGGSGGDLSVVSLAFSVESAVNLRGVSGASAGSFDVKAGGPVTVNAALQVTGSGTGAGGTVSVQSEADVLIAAAVDTRAGRNASAAGSTQVSGCDVEISSSGLLATSGAGGVNRVQGRGAVRIAGSMLADPESGRNEIRFRTGFPPQLPGKITPSATLLGDPVLVPCGVATATPTFTESLTPTRTPTPTVSGVPTRSATPTPTGTRTRTRPTELRSPTPTPTATYTPTVRSVACAGDCDEDGAVTVSELIRGVNIALGNAGLDVCPPFDINGDGRVTVNELISGVRAALDGCPVAGVAAP